MRKWIGILASIFFLPTGMFAEEPAPSRRLEFRLAVTEPAEGHVRMPASGKEEPVYVSETVIGTGADIEKVSFSTGVDGQPMVGLRLTEAGASRFWEATSAHIGKKVAILLGDEVVAAPRIMDGIRREVIITGNFGERELLGFFRALVLRATVGQADLPEDDPKGP